MTYSRHGERPFDYKYTYNNVSDISSDEYISYDIINKKNKATNVSKREILIESIGNFPI